MYIFDGKIKISAAKTPTIANKHPHLSWQNYVLLLTPHVFWPKSRLFPCESLFLTSNPILRRLNPPFYLVLSQFLIVSFHTLDCFIIFSAQNSIFFSGKDVFFAGKVAILCGEFALFSGGLRTPHFTRVNFRQATVDVAPCSWRRSRWRVSVGWVEPPESSTSKRRRRWRWGPLVYNRYVYNPYIVYKDAINYMTNILNIIKSHIWIYISHINHTTPFVECITPLYIHIWFLVWNIFFQKYWE